MSALQYSGLVAMVGASAVSPMTAAIVGTVAAMVFGWLLGDRLLERFLRWSRRERG